jgi:hypothetical protein
MKITWRLRNALAYTLFGAASRLSSMGIRIAVFDCDECNVYGTDVRYIDSVSRMCPTCKAARI